MLAQHFLQQFVMQNSKKIKGFTPQAMEKLLKYSWPGNIRELMNAIEERLFCRVRNILMPKSWY